MSTNVNTIRDLAEREYKWGFVTDIEEERVPKGLNEDTIRLISAKKNEPRVHARVATQGVPALGCRSKTPRPSRSGPM